MRPGRPTQLIFAALALLAAACAGGDGPALETSGSPTAGPSPGPTAASSTTTSTTAATTTSTAAATPAATAEENPTPGRSSYIVAAGDGLAAIARAHGVSLDNLITANGIADPNQLVVGQELVIPAPGETFEPPPPPPTGPPDQPGSADPPAATPPPPAPIANGGDVYFNHCSGCHGDSGEGAAGPALGGGAVVAKYPNPVDQIALVTNGGSAMPAFGGIITPEEIEAVVYFTRSL